MSSASTESNPSDEVRRLRLQVEQLKNVIKKLTDQKEPHAGEEEEERKGKKVGRKFDHT